MNYTITVNALNPVEYLACCGIFEILSRFDPEATAAWDVTSTNFVIHSHIRESAIAEAIVRSLGDQQAWNRFPDKSVKTFGDDAQAVQLSLRLRFEQHETLLTFDWWYETLNEQLEIADKSIWKFYAGQQTADQIVQNMSSVFAQKSNNQQHSLSQLVTLSEGMKGRFGFDPRSTRNALDAGFSANDLSQPVETYMGCELLATIGIQYFFPHRVSPSNAIARGWADEDHFLYGLWLQPVPVALARTLAAGVNMVTDSVRFVQAYRARRDKYSNFRMAVEKSLGNKNSI